MKLCKILFSIVVLQAQQSWTLMVQWQVTLYSQHNIHLWVSKLAAHTTTVVMATHNLALIEELNLRTIVLDRGRIIGDFDNPRGAH